MASACLPVLWIFFVNFESVFAAFLRVQRLGAVDAACVHGFVPVNVCVNEFPSEEKTDAQKDETDCNY